SRFCDAAAWSVLQLGAPTVAYPVEGSTINFPPAACVAATAESNAAQPCEGGRKSGMSRQGPCFSHAIQSITGGDCTTCCHALAAWAMVGQAFPPGPEKIVNPSFQAMSPVFFNQSGMFLFETKGPFSVHGCWTAQLRYSNAASYQSP